MSLITRICRNSKSDIFLLLTTFLLTEGIIEMLGNENVCPNIELALERAKQLMEKTHHPK